MLVQNTLAYYCEGTILFLLYFLLRHYKLARFTLIQLSLILQVRLGAYPKARHYNVLILNRYILLNLFSAKHTILLLHKQRQKLAYSIPIFM